LPASRRSTAASSRASSTSTSPRPSPPEPSGHPLRKFEISRWAFSLGDTPEAWAKGYDDAAWRRLTVPHDWSVEQEFAPAHSSGTGYLAGGIGWYRAHVSLRELGELAGKHVRLVFHGVYKNARVWVNGYHLGGRPSGYAEFSFDLDEILSYASGDDLVISVRVEHTDISDSRWFNGTGINRRVELEVHEAVRLREHGIDFTTIAADATTATARIAIGVVNGTGDAVDVHVRHELRSLSSERRHVFTADLPLPKGGSGTVAAIGDVPEPELWSDATPNLYRLTTTLTWTQDGVDRSATYDDTVGIRTFRFDPDSGFSINGEPRKLKGVCLHEDAGCLGTAVPTEVWLRRLLKLQQMGCNAIRMAHNPHAPELYRLCDALGFFVIDEAFDEWENPKNKWWQGHNVNPPRHQGYAHDFHEWHERDLAAMIDAHRNHPSIIAWSIGNEIDYPNDPYASAMFEAMTGNNDANKSAKQRAYDPNRPDARRLATIARRLVEIVKAKDATRPVTVGSAFPELSRHTGFLDRLDLVGYNYKEHLYEADHRQYPNQPMLGSENWHRYSDWLAAADNDYISGQFLWTGIDYLGETYVWPHHGSTAGLLTVAGYEKHAFHLRRSWWSDAAVAYMATRPHVEGAAKEEHLWSHASASRIWDATSGPVEVRCFANGEPKLSCGTDEIPLTRSDEHGYWFAITTARAEPLVLETRRGGEVARDELRFRGDAARLDAQVWQAPGDAARRCAAAGLPAGDVVQIECVVRDANGEVARDERVVTAEVVSGDLLGIENGDLSDNTAYASSHRQTHDGRLIVFVRASGRASVQLSAPGLADVVVECGGEGR
jgi:beta-galactosidase